MSTFVLNSPTCQSQPFGASASGVAEGNHRPSLASRQRLDG
jgi:hypothetical protein